MRYIRPKTLDEATKIFASGGFKILAGGTDLYPALRDRPVETDILDISQIPGIRGISKTETGWRIGACTTWSDIVRTPLPDCFSGLQQAAKEIGSIQIQNVGTIGGNLCNASPAADSIPPLLTLNAAIEISASAYTRYQDLSEFLLDVRKTTLEAGEIVTGIFIPDQTGFSSFQKIGARKYLIISIAMAATAVEIESDGAIKSARIAIGSCSPVARRMNDLEHSIIGAKLNRHALSERINSAHFQNLSPIDDFRGDVHYRLEAVHELVIRLLLDCADKRKGKHS